jgi:hypothetical protein
MTVLDDRFLHLARSKSYQYLWPSLCPHELLVRRGEIRMSNLALKLVQSKVMFVFLSTALSVERSFCNYRITSSTNSAELGYGSVTPKVTWFLLQCLLLWPRGD